jgi:hypothetical protein
MTASSPAHSAIADYPLLRRAAVDAERLPVTAHQVHALVGPDPAQRAAPPGDQHQAGVAGQPPRLVEVEDSVVVQLVELAGPDLDLGHPGPAGLRGQLGEVLLRVEAHRGRLDPHRQVLGDQGDAVTLLGQVVGHRQDARVVVTEPEPRRQGRGIGVVELDAQGAAAVADRHRLVETAVPDPQVVEHPQRRPGEVPQLGVVTLALQLGDHHDGDHHLVLVEAVQRARVRQQHAGVQHVGASGAGIGPRTCRRGGAQRSGHWCIPSWTGTRVWLAPVLLVTSTDRA